MVTDIRNDILVAKQDLKGFFSTRTLGDYMLRKMQIGVQLGPRRGEAYPTSPVSVIWMNLGCHVRPTRSHREVLCPGKAENITCLICVWLRIIHQSENC